MRNRNNITTEYLHQLLQRISTLLQQYNAHIHTLWFQKEELANVASLMKKLDRLNMTISSLPDDSLQRKNNAANPTIHLKKVTIKELANENPDVGDVNLESYRLMLSCLNDFCRSSKHPDHQKMQDLHALLLNEVKTQQEAEWREDLSMNSALQNIESHALYASAKEKLYVDKWNVSITALQDFKKNYRGREDATAEINPKKNLKWDVMCQSQWWHIQRNDRYEISLSAQSLLGLDDDNPNPLGCFVLQEPRGDIVSLTEELRHKNYSLTIRSQTYRDKIEKLRTQKRQAKDTTQSSDIIRQIKEIESERSDYEREQHAAIRELTKKIQTLQIEQVLQTTPDDTHKSPLTKLYDFNQELSMWTPRNLSILFIDNIIETQIVSLRALEGKSNPVEDNRYDDFYDRNVSLCSLIDNMSDEMERILVAVNEAHAKIREEKRLLQRIIDDRLVDTYQIESSTRIQLLHVDSSIDVKDAVQDFTRYAKEHLLRYTTSAHFEAAKKELRYSETGRYGVILPREEDIIAAVDHPAENITETGSLRRSQRVLSSLHQLGTPVVMHENADDDSVESDDDELAPLIPAPVPPQPAADLPQQPQRAGLSTTAKVLIGIAIGAAIAIAVAGIIAGIVFSAGTGAAPAAGAALAFGAMVSAKIGTGGLIGLFSGIFAGGLFGGLLGGIAYARLSTPANTPVPQPGVQVATNNAQLHQGLGVTHDLRISTRLRSNSTPTLNVDKGKRTLFRSATSPTLSALPSARNQKTTVALARNGSRH